MNLWKFSFLIIFSTIILSGCDNETEPMDVSTLGLDYFPLGIDKYIDYHIDSTVYNFQNGSIESFTSYIREQIVEQFFDVNNDTVYRIERSWKRSENDPWKVVDEWAASRSLSQATRTEENLRFVKLVFPPLTGTRWDGNIHIPENFETNVGGELIEVYKNWDYRIQEQLETDTISGLQIEDVIVIRQADDENALERRFSVEKYARNIGLIYRDMIILDTQCIAGCEGMTWEDKAEKGFILHQEVIGYN